MSQDNAYVSERVQESLCPSIYPSQSIHLSHFIIWFITLQELFLDTTVALDLRLPLTLGCDVTRSKVIDQDQSYIIIITFIQKGQL